MAKRPPLEDARLPARQIEPPKKKPRSWVAPIRENKRIMSVYISEEAFEQAKMRLANRDEPVKSIQHMLVEAIDMWFASRGLHRLAGDGQHER